MTASRIAFVVAFVLFVVGTVLLAFGHQDVKVGLEIDSAGLAAMALGHFAP